MPAIGSLALALLIATPPTPLESATPHFYGAVGTQVQVRWQIVPSAVVAEQEFDVELVVVGHNPTQPLQMLPRVPYWQALEPRVQVLSRTRTGNRIITRVRCLTPGPLTLPELPFTYIRPQLPEGKRVRLTYAAPLRLEVQAAVMERQTVAVVDWQKLSRSEGEWVPMWAWLVPLVLTPLIGFWPRKAEQRPSSRTLRRLHQQLVVAQSGQELADLVGQLGLTEEQAESLREPLDSVRYGVTDLEAVRGVVIAEFRKRWH